MPTFANANANAASAAPKKDKPLVKTPIPDTDWIRVKTVQGNTFYNNKSTKASVWFIPEDIRDAVRALDEEEAVAERQKHLNMEVERVKSDAGRTLAKRKADTLATSATAAKKPKPGADADDDDSDDSEEEEEWQKEAAAQLAAEAEAAEQQKREEKERQAEEARMARREMEEKAAQLNLPRREDLSIEEAKALFKVSNQFWCVYWQPISPQTLLREKNINPLLPWDISLPQFVSDPRYGMLTSVATRRDVFDEYCRERARELREQAINEQKETIDPGEAFERLLREEVKSTRTRFVVR
jgi:transcription elongation regulator 1